MTTKPILSISALVLWALLVTSARADSFGSGGNVFTIDFVTIGDPGNPMDTGTTGLSASPFGAVSYAFQMGKYEVSGDIIDKANALGALLITRITRGANQPASGVTWNEAARFVNWLNTSQGYSVAYKFAVNPGDAGYTSNSVANTNLVLWTPGDAGYDANNLYRNSNAHYFLPSENEWYKAAFYSGNGTTYYDFATGSDTPPLWVASGTAAATAVYNGVTTAPADCTLSGGLSHYGTMGQNGNVIEWVESDYAAPNDSPVGNRTLRGGTLFSTGTTMRSSGRTALGPTFSESLIGFRVASVPEPSTAVLLLGGSALLGLRRRA